MEEICKECQHGFLKKSYFDEYGKKVKEYSCGHTVKIVVVNEIAQGHENIVVVRYYHFKLLDKVFLGGHIVSSKEIELEFDPNDNKYLIGFTIKGKSDDQEEDLELVLKEANRLTNLLSVKTNQYVYHNRPEITIKKDGKTTSTKSFTMGAILVFPIDFDLTKKSHILTQDSKLNRQLDNYANGLKAIQDSDFEEAMRRFYTVLEKDLPTHLQKYRILRGGLSHLELNERTRRSLINQFQIECTINQDTGEPSLDTTSPKIKLKLKDHAQILQSAAYTILKDLIK